jgi:hypothetical protein
MNRLTLPLLVGVALILGVLGVFGASGSSTAQDRDAERIAALEAKVSRLETDAYNAKSDAERLATQVAEQYEFILNFSGSIGPNLLPAPETEPTYTANTIRVSPFSGFRVYCTLHDTAVMSASPLYALDCFRIDPAVDPLLAR